MTDTPFASRLFARVLGAAGAFEPDRDAARLRAVPAHRALRARTRLAVAQRAARHGWTRQHFDRAEAAARLTNLTAGLPGLERTYALLADEPSRALLVDLFAFRVLGAAHVRSPVSFVAYEEAKAGLAVVDPDVRVVADAYTPRLSRFRVAGPSGRPITLVSAAAELASVFVLHQYRHPEVAAAPGDVVIDGGAGWGDTALYFADAVGPQGRVVSFEISPENVAILEANRAENADLATVPHTVVPHALWHVSGERLGFSEAGQASVLGSGEGAVTEVETRTLDDVVAELGLPRVGLVKLDIEGAEPQALSGMRETLRRDRPKLAIALYHDPMHFIEIPAAIDDLGLGYRFHLGQGAPGTPETILFATT